MPAVQVQYRPYPRIRQWENKDDQGASGIANKNAWKSHERIVRGTAREEGATGFQGPDAV